MGKALGIVALIFSIIGVTLPILCFLPIWILIFPGLFYLIISISCSIVAIVCGAIGIKKDDSPGLAIAGLVLGSIGIIIWMGFFYRNIFY